MDNFELPRRFAPGAEMGTFQCAAIGSQRDDEEKDTLFRAFVRVWESLLQSQRCYWHPTPHPPGKKAALFTLKYLTAVLNIPKHVNPGFQVCISRVTRGTSALTKVP